MESEHGCWDYAVLFGKKRREWRRRDIPRLGLTRCRMFLQVYKLNYLICAIVPSVMNKRRSIYFCQGARGSGRVRTYAGRALPSALHCELEGGAMVYKSSVVCGNDEAGEAYTGSLEEMR